MPQKNSGKPEFMLTYLCPKCGFDFARTEREKPACFYCENTRGHKILSKKKITPELIAERLRAVSDRLLGNLKKAWEVRPPEISDDPRQEREFLDLLNRAKDFKKEIGSITNDLEKRRKAEKRERER